jgi:hypothetical protein
MNKLRYVAIPAAVISLLGIGNAIAQDQTDQTELASKIVATEVYACTYRDGRGPGDLDDASDAWNAWADERGVDDYAAWTLTPYHYGPNQDFDVIWLGAWTDGNAMGAGVDLLLAEGGDELANFNETMICNNHITAGSINYKLPDGGTPAASSVITFSNCDIEEGRTYQEVVDATQAWADILTDAGSQAAIYHWFTIYGGGGDDEPDFIRLTAYPNHTELGADFERLTNGELFRNSNALFGGLVSCDVARVYNAQGRRAAQLR